MTEAPINNGRKTDGTFAEGNSGGGRPKGSANKATIALRALLEGEAEQIGRTTIELAKAGEIAAIRLVLERILPPRKDAPVSFALPQINKAEDIPTALAAIVDAVVQGELTPSEGQAIAGLLEYHRKAIETCLLERKLDALQAIIQPRK